MAKDQYFPVNPMRLDVWIGMKFSTNDLILSLNMSITYLSVQTRRMIKNKAQNS